jgi:hypothetical protein
MLALGLWPKSRLLLASALAWSKRPTPSDVKPADLRAGPGEIINVWPLEGGAPGGGDAFRILYRSTDLNGEPIAVSGAIFIPPGAPPQSGRNIIAWAHPRSRVLWAVAPVLSPKAPPTRR